MLLLTSSQSQELDTRSTTEFPITSPQLMESAAKASLHSLREFFAQKSAFHRVILLVGPGNNGEDTKLFQRHWPEFFTSRPDFILISISPSENPSLKISEIPLDVDLIVDGFFGTGLKRSIGALYAQILDHLKKSRAFVLAMDLPSGLDADTGKVRGTALRADLTVTFGAAKPGLLQCEGPGLAGHVRIDPLIFPRSLLREVARDLRAFGINAARKLLPPRPLSGHKGSFGHVYLFAGSEKYRGAGILTARAALSAGAGYVHLIGGKSVYPEVLQLPEVIYDSLQAFDFDQVDAKKSCFVVGPGFSDLENLRKVLRALVRIQAERVVIDAEAFRVLEDGKFDGKSLPSSWLLTPHPGELARLLDCETSEVESNRIEAASKAHKFFGAVVLLKGFRTLIVDDQLKTLVLAGNSALGKAGSGDVLAGVIAAFWAQGLGTREAALIGAFVHGFVATTYVREGNDAATLIPSRTIELLPYVMRILRQGPGREA